MLPCLQVTLYEPQDMMLILTYIYTGIYISTYEDGD